MKIDPKIEREQVERVRAVRAAPRRDASTPRRFAASRPRRRASDNLLPLILDAVKAEATVGEIADVLRERLGRAPGDARSLTP